MDQLHTHSPASLDAAFQPAEAQHRTDKLGIYDTPEHGRWLNMAELALSILERQYLRRRGAAASRIAWQFTPADARTKLRRLYPADQA